MDKRPIAGIILAAGMATRFGRLKQLLKVGDSTILSMVIDAAIKSDLDRIVLVLGHEAEAIKDSLGETLLNPRLITIINPRFQEGMSTSLQRGLAEVRAEFSSIMVLMGDQPLLSHEVINLILKTFRASEKDICAPVYNGKRGLPVCFSDRFYDEILGIRGDVGAREIIRNNHADVLTVEIEEQNSFFDIDSEADLERLKSLLKGGFNMEPKNLKEDLLELAIEWADTGRKPAIATVISTWGAASHQTGSQLIVDSKGAFEGAVSGGCVEPAVITEAFEVIKSGRPKMVSFGVSDEQAWDVGMTCGGRIDIYIESLDMNRGMLEKVIELKRAQFPVCIITDLATGEAVPLNLSGPEWMAEVSPEMKAAVFDAIKRGGCGAYDVSDRRYYIHGIYPSTRLIIIGAVDIARALAHMAALSNYKVLIIDPRAAFATAERFPGMELMVEWPDEILANMTIHWRTAIVALTHDPKIDDPALKEALRSKAFYIGALGSRKTHADRLGRLRLEGFSEEELGRIHGPVGLDIGAKTHAEIAVAILAEIIKRHRKGPGETGR